MKTLFLIPALLWTATAFSQEMVPNGDFEQTLGCPHDANQLDSVAYWMNTSPDVQNSGTPDYFNACDTFLVDVPANPYYGYQVAHSGNAYAGIILYTQAFGGNVREYIETPFVQPLTPGFLYHFEMYLNVPNNFLWTSDDIGVYFSDTAVTNVTNWAPLSQFVPDIVNPQGNEPDTSGWMLVSGNYWASGGESYMIIGNFRNDFQTSATPVHQGGNPYAYVYIDDVSLSHGVGIEETNNPHGVTVYPNPANELLHFSAVGNAPFAVRVYDLTGQLLQTETLINGGALDVSGYAPGIYLYELQFANGDTQKGKFVRD